MGVLIHEPHVPDLIVRDIPMVIRRIVGLPLDVDGGDMMSGPLKDGDAITQATFGTVVAIVIEKDAVGKKR